MPDDSKIQTGAARAAGLFTIQAAAEAAGLSTKMLRHYEDVGLLGDVKRSESGYRIYSQDDVLRLQVVASGRAAGFSLDEVRAMMDAAGAGLSAGYMQMIVGRITELERLEGLLSALPVSNVFAFASSDKTISGGVTIGKRKKPASKVVAGGW